MGHNPERVYTQRLITIAATEMRMLKVSSTIIIAAEIVLHVSFLQYKHMTVVIFIEPVTNVGKVIPGW